MIRRVDWQIISGGLNLQQCLCKNRIPIASLTEGAHINISLQTSIRAGGYIYSRAGFNNIRIPKK